MDPFRDVIPDSTDEFRVDANSIAITAISSARPRVPGWRSTSKLDPLALPEIILLKSASMADALRTFFSLNEDLIFFASGLSFFMMGFAIALQSRHASRLDLARSLTWLAGFGIAHGLHEWGDYFIPIQAAYLSAPVISVLHGLRLTLLAVSFAYLFEFGARLLRPPSMGRTLRRINIALFGLWLVAGLGVVPVLVPEPAQARSIADALARYFLGLPGGLLAAYALRRHTLERLQPLNAPHIVSMLRRAGLTLGGYALFAGLVPPPVPFFPGNLLNSQTLSNLLVVPPALIRAILGFALTYTIIRALEVFDLEATRALERMEQEQILAAERTRLARDLHDGAIQKVYTAGLLLESGLHFLKGNREARSRLDRTVDLLNDAISDLRINLRELQPDPDGLSLRQRLQEIGHSSRLSSMIDIHLDLDLPDDSRLDSYRTDHISSIVSEALANAIRHAGANRVRIAASVANGELVLRIEDDGIGLPEDLQAGFGLRNMRDRARLIQGTLELSNAPQKGARVELRAPWDGDPI